jgi:anti-sigma factor (TIGR02949 family)
MAADQGVILQVLALIRSRMAQIDRYTCEETIRRLDDYLDRELTPHEMQLVNEHLEVCAMCASEYAFEARALERLRDKLSRIAAPADLMVKVSRALERAQGEGSPP